MKSDDYKRGVRDMAAAMRKVHVEHSLSFETITECEERLRANPVPKFAVGQVVAIGTRSVGFITGVLPNDPVKYYVQGDWRPESTLRALTPLEVTGKE